MTGTAHHAAGRRNAHILYRIISQIHQFPVVGHDVIQALVPRGHQNFGIGSCLQGETVFRAGIGLVLETGESQRQAVFVLRAPILPVILHRTPVDKVEQLQAHGVRITVLISKGKVLQGVIGHMEGILYQYIAILPIEDRHAPYIPFGAAYPGHNIVLGRHLLRPRHKQPRKFRAQFPAVLRHVENTPALLSGHRLSRSILGRCLRLQHVGTRSGKVQRKIIAGSGFARGHRLAGGVKELVLHGQRNRRAAVVQGLQGQFQGGLRHHVLRGVAQDGGQFPLRDIGRRKVGIGRIEEGGLHGEVAAHEEARAEAAGFAAGIGDGDLGPVESAFRRGEGGLKGIVIGQLDVLIQDHVAVIAHFHMDARASQRMAGIADELAAHGNFVARQVQLVGLVKLQVEGREHELVHAEPVVAQALGFQLEAAVPQAHGQHKAAGGRAPVVGL